MISYAYNSMKQPFDLNPPFTLALIALIATGCAADNSAQGVVTTCALPSDQPGTLTGRWATNPIPVALHEGDFNPDEVAAISAAVSTWNTFFGQSANLTILNAGNGTFTTSNATLPTASVLCSMSNIVGSNFTQPLVIYKDTTWPYSSETQAMALTSYCRNSASSGSTGASASFSDPSSSDSEEHGDALVSRSDAATTIQAQLPTFRMAMTEVNYQYFFTTNEVPDLQTIMLHELGHVLGLGHSCDNTGLNGYPTCTGDGANVLYQQAVMYPVFGFDSSGNGQQRRSLTSNDEARANCLYQP